MKRANHLRCHKIRKGVPVIKPFYYCYEKHDCLSEKIESIRLQLIQAVDNNKSFTDLTVVRLSQELDVYLLEFQKRSEAN
ncbi:aspartyl-phosphate phosphatase Spo0E family protein [Paenibacillus profundus]|uniref:Aspartyl-phosphate phosphatase Spo0E family protein n=1 Tax=Paenibacillus profundus TaxID=1173085 RepID=A0ABS8YMW3_9BACL|nr:MULTISPECIES: aspartyl-phosphate phosphatase Spo0E family protein [Paenibacillus]MCE5171651.1 aspartyl-phosphate phosphatase Spo0E family protein [Paenibacillus profundus]MCM3337617.1 aspartyl-phosphate phosphatase Spo0E family protein [Paenibacillus sp. MER TA 81-3]